MAAWFGLALLVATLAAMSTTGWPSHVVLLGVSVVGALLGHALGWVDFALLGSLGTRLVGLLEHDLLQALALYALVGALLARLGVADALFAGLGGLAARVHRRSAGASATFGLAVLLAPMNGSVGASLVAMFRASRLDGRTPSHTELARITAAATLGALVPPSIVLLLFGDAMLRAHTEGLVLARTLSPGWDPAAIRVINTQDVLQATLLPAAAVLLSWWLVAMLAEVAAGRRPGRGIGASLQATPAAPAVAAATVAKRDKATLYLVAPAIVALMVLVGQGRMRAVEAAATAGVVLLVWGLVSRQLDRPRLTAVLDDALALTGALFALLVAATTFSLLLRALGTDRLVADVMLSLQGQPRWALCVVLAVLLAAACVLDAFELVFLVVPIVMPPLLAQVEDAAWVGAAALLALQAGFLLPPFGYALVLARGLHTPRPPLAGLARALAPYLACSALVMAVVILWPEVTRWARTAPLKLPEHVLSPEETERALREMSARPPGQ